MYLKICFFLIFVASTAAGGTRVPVSFALTSNDSLLDEDLLGDPIRPSYPEAFGIPTIEAQIRGNKYNFILDSGFAIADVALTRAMVDTLNIQLDGGERCASSVNSARQCYKTFDLEAFRIGDLNIQNIKGVVLDEIAFPDAILPRNGPKAGFVGLGLLKKFNILFNFPLGEMVIYENHPSFASLSARPENWAEIAFTSENGIETAATVGGKKLKLLWDTGAPMCILEESLGLGSTRLRYFPGFGMMMAVRPERFQIESVLLDGRNFAVQDLHNTGLHGFIGNDFMFDHQVFIDFQRLKLHLEVSKN